MSINVIGYGLKIEPSKGHRNVISCIQLVGYKVKSKNSKNRTSPNLTKVHIFFNKN